MSQTKNRKERVQRFKIQVIKKKANRIQSSPRKQQLKTDNGLSRIFQFKLSTGGKNTHHKNPQDSGSTVFQHTKVKSELSNFYQDNLFSSPQYQLEQVRESIIINSIPHKNYPKYSDESFDEADFGFSRFDQKFSQQKRFKYQNRYKFSPFESLNVVKCQSITLIRASRKNKTDMRPHQCLARKQGIVPAKKIKLTAASTSKIMSFNLNNDMDSMYMKKMKIHLDFLFKVNYSNKIFIPFDLKQSEPIKRYKVFVGWGNNHQLVKNCLKSRFWIDVVDHHEEPDVRFYWTSWPVPEFYQKQKNRRKANQQHYDWTTRVQKIDSETLRCNQKILLGREATKVQNFITPDGYMIPFPEYQSPASMSNHLSGSALICQKKKLFHSLFHYYHSWLKMDPFSVIPVTYIVTGLQDPEYKRFMRDHEGKEEKIWIVKPGQNTNRGQGIYLAKTEDVAQLLVQGLRQSYVIQSYIGKPLLYNGRKFDVRHFFLVTSINGHLKAYWFKQGYIRTSSEPFDLTNPSDKFTHLTNDAVQKYSKSYGMYQPANKVSYRQFQRYLETIFPKRHINFQADILDKVKEIIKNVIKATYRSLDKKQKQGNFELFGIDFMIDRDLNPWLIQINENPCLETNCQLLCRLIPSLIENTLRLCLDPLLPPLNHFPAKLRSSFNDHFLKTLKYEIIFDQEEYEKFSYDRTSRFNLNV